jgi:hypothetical protein
MEVQWLRKVLEGGGTAPRRQAEGKEGLLDPVGRRKRAKSLEQKDPL